MNRKKSYSVVGTTAGRSGAGARARATATPSNGKPGGQSSAGVGQDSLVADIQGVGLQQLRG